MPTIDEFREALGKLLKAAKRAAKPYLEVNAGKLHRELGGYPGAGHRMPVCCEAMYQAMKAGDKVIARPPKGKGASLTIRYKLPHQSRPPAAPSPSRAGARMKYKARSEQGPQSEAATNQLWAGSMTSWFADGLDGPFPCEVRISGDRIVVSYDGETAPIVYEGRALGDGHYELRAPDGRATLHRTPRSHFLEGYFLEEGGSGMWRIELVEDRSR